MSASQRFAVPVMTTAAALAVGWSVLVACGGSGGATPVTAPSSGCNETLPTVTCNIVQVTVASDGPYTLITNGQTFVATSASTNRVYLRSVPVADGLLITGTMGDATRGGTTVLTITLSSVTAQTGGVVQRGTLASIVGPVVTTAPCSIAYSDPAGRAQQFSMRYTLYLGPDRC